MLTDDERVAHGRALLTGELGGAKAGAEVTQLVEALALLPMAAYSPGLLMALAAVDSLAERNATQAGSISRLTAELASAKGVEAVQRRERDAAQARCNNAELRQRELLADCLLFAAESDELRAVLAPLALALGRLPLAVAGELAELYGRAAALDMESPAERCERLSRKLESGN